jgi:hypothetical protein
MGPLALSGCGPTPKLVVGKKDIWGTRVYNNEIDWRILTTIEFDQSVAVAVSRLMDAILNERGEFAHGVPVDIAFLINEPYRFIGEQISTPFLPATIYPPKRRPHEAAMRHEIESQQVTLSSLPKNARNIPSILHAKPANYRWKISSYGWTTCAPLSPNKLFSDLRFTLTVEQHQALSWGKTDGDWMDNGKTEDLEDVLFASLHEKWPRLIEDRFSLTPGTIHVERGITHG